MASVQLTQVLELRDQTFMSNVWHLVFSQVYKLQKWVCLRVAIALRDLAGECL